MPRPSLYRQLFGLAASVLLLAGCVPASSSPAAAGRTPVRVALDWLPNTNHTGIFVARQQGWYEAEGLEVTILPYAQGSDTGTLVAAGQAEFAISSAEAVTLARAAEQPIVSVAAILQKNTSAFVSVQGSGLDRPAKLAGTRYAGFGSPFEEPVIAAMLDCDGASSTKVQSVTAGLFGLDAIVAGQADFVWIFMGWEGLQAQRQGVALNVMPPQEYCIPNYYTPVVISSEKVVREQNEAARRFMRATARGYQMAIREPDQAAELLLQSAPAGTFPEPELVRESARWLAPRYAEGRERWGEQDLETWTEYPRFMIRTGFLRDGSGRPVTTDLDYRAFYTNELLP